MENENKYFSQKWRITNDFHATNFLALITAILHVKLLCGHITNISTNLVQNIVMVCYVFLRAWI
jgi:hypothetical protein